LARVLIRALAWGGPAPKTFVTGSRWSPNNYPVFFVLLSFFQKKVTVLFFWRC